MIVPTEVVGHTGTAKLSEQIFPDFGGEIEEPSFFILCLNKRWDVPERNAAKVQNAATTTGLTFACFTSLGRCEGGHGT